MNTYAVSLSKLTLQEKKKQNKTKQKKNKTKNKQKQKQTNKEKNGEIKKDLLTFVSPTCKRTAKFVR